MPILLAGGAEYTPGNDAMDAAALAAVTTGRQGADLRVVVLPFAGAPGRERRVAAANAERWYAHLGVPGTRAVTDETDPGLPALLDAADVVVLPGGSPDRLLAALAPLRDRLAAVSGRGGLLTGSSAGAMVLCRWTVRPASGPDVVPGLQVADADLVLPHHRGGPAGGRWWSRITGTLPDGAVVLGVPERCGVLLDAGTATDLGTSPVARLPVRRQPGQP